jgi:NAD(P)H dehydrogenase (quinone)
VGYAFGCAAYDAAMDPRVPASPNSHPAETSVPQCAVFPSARDALGDLRTCLLHDNEGNADVSKFSGATIGVTGASGNLGRHVVQHLQASGAKRIVAISRSPDKLHDLASPNVEFRSGSFDEPAGLAAAFAGIERLLIISTADVLGRMRQQINAAEAAVKAGVKHIAYTSIVSPYPDTDHAAAIPNSHYWTETTIAASGVDFSLLRNNLYTDFLIPAAQHAIATGALYHATGSGRRAFVTREDCAAAAAAALLNAEGKHVYDIGGQDALSAEDLAALLTTISGRAVNAVNVSPEALRSGLTQAGVPEVMAGALTRFDVDASKGYLGIVSGDFDRLVHRKPRSVADFLTAHKAAIVK